MCVQDVEVIPATMVAEYGPIKIKMTLTLALTELLSGWEKVLEPSFQRKRS